MGARAEAAERTAERICDAAIELFRKHPFDEVTLDAISERAGVSLQTVLRRFRSKDGLLDAAATASNDRIFAARSPAKRRDVRSAVEALVASYEEMGDLGWSGLCQEDRFPSVKKKMNVARKGHRAWVESTFAHLLPRHGAERERRVLLLFAATDFYVWKLYRRDLDIGRAATVERMIDLVNAVRGNE